MRVTLLFPPSLCLPNQVYYALPQLAGELRRAGHEPRCVDLNLACADRLLEPAMVEELLGVAQRLRRNAEAAGDHRWSAEIQRHVDTNEAVVRAGPLLKRNLREAARYHDKRTFHDSFWGIVDALAAFYTLDPLVSPFRPDFQPTRSIHWSRRSGPTSSR
jgi:hypothetical protein